MQRLDESSDIGEGDRIGSEVQILVHVIDIDYLRILRDIGLTITLKDRIQESQILVTIARKLES